MTGAPKGKAFGEGAGCHNNGNCDSCPYTDCVASSYECIKFYKAEEARAKARYSLAAVYKTPKRPISDEQREKQRESYRRWYKKHGKERRRRLKEKQ